MNSTTTDTPGGSESSIDSGKKHAGGRPTKLTPELLAKAYSYVYQDNVPEFIEVSASPRIIVNTNLEVLPTVERLALTLGVSRSTVYKWATENEEFSDILEDLLSKQADVLISKGLEGKFNATITKLLLSGKHGYVEKSQQDVDVTSKGDSVVMPSDQLRTDFAEYLKQRK